MGERRWLIWVAVGCLVLAGLCCVIALAGGYFYFTQTRTAGESPGVAYILDTSTRMGQETEGGSRLGVARGIMSEIVRPGNPELTAGLRVFGSGAVPQSCEDTELVVPFQPANQARIADELGQLDLGAADESAMAQAMVDAIRDLANTDGPQSLVVVTGGADSCNPQAGEFIAREAELAGIRLQTFVVGFDLSPEEAEAIKGMVSQIPGATYYDAPDAEALRTSLGDIQVTLNEKPNPAPGPAPQTSTGQTACDHPYFPIRPGSSWAFSGDGFSYSLTVESVSGDMQSATADVASSFDVGGATIEWTCGAGGVSFTQLSAVSVPEVGGVGKFEIIDQSGNTLPTVAELESGASWDSSYSMTYSIGIVGFENAFTTHTTESHSAGSPQTVTVPAGTFQAIPVTTEGTTSTSGEMAIGDSSFTSVVYFAKDVGIVRIESSSEGYSITLDLVSYSVP